MLVMIKDVVFNPAELTAAKIGNFYGLDLSFKNGKEICIPSNSLGEARGYLDEIMKAGNKNEKE